jgi:uncharacterized protein
MKRKSNPVGFKNVQITGGFWGGRITLVSEKVIPYQRDALNDSVPGAEPSHAVENFRIAAGLSKGEFKGFPFQDSDLAKWMEAASYSLAHHPNASIEKALDELIDLMAKAQRPDGYLNTYFTVAAPDKRWTDFSGGHELYSAGHIFEAAVAHFTVTGKRSFIDLAGRYADYIISVIGPEKGKMKVYCGHPEVELALCKLYRATGEERYLKLAEFFIDERGKAPVFLKSEPTFSNGKKDRWLDTDYHQAHLPIREQTTAEGHSVRAMYLYSGMADVAAETGDVRLASSLRRIWENVVTRRMYVTGGLGSQAYGERFTIDYDLPNDTAYAETCASIGLVFWAHRMLLLEPDRRYADVLERSLYNGSLSGISLDGTKYFYVNPLEVHPATATARKDHEHVKTERVPWFGCACCPPNIARLITSLGEYLYSVEGRTVYAHLYADSTADVRVAGQKVVLTEKTDYPWDGRISFSVDTEKPIRFALALRVPGWCGGFACTVNGERIESGVEDSGYLVIDRTWSAGDSAELILDMQVRLMSADPRVRADIGKIAIQRGPLVYCLEEADNGPDLHAIILSPKAKFKADWEPDTLGGAVVVRGDAVRIVSPRRTEEPYDSILPETEPTTVTAVPYCLWCNRKPGEMSVWIRCGD